MEFIYSTETDTNKPIMIINGHIGFDDEAGMGVDGHIFKKELMALDSMGKDSIEIQINSPGGSVTEGYSIFSAMVMAKTHIETINVGLCASTASWLFEAGDTRVAMDYSITMVHNPFNASGNESKALAVFKDSIVKMLSNRTGKTEQEISEMMEIETWMDSSDCKEMGFCTEIRTSKNENKPVLSKTKNAFKEAFNFVNSITNNNKPIIKMNYSKICNKLNIMEDSNESTILNTLDTVLNKAAADFDSIKNSLTEKENELIEAKKTIAELEQSKLDALDAQNALVAKAMVAKYSNRVSADSIESWEKKAAADMSGTEELLNSIPLNLVGKNLTKNEGAETEKFEAPTNASALMAQVRINNLKK